MANRKPLQLLWGWLKPRYLNSIAGFVIAGAGDLLCQRYFEHPHSKNPENHDFSSKAFPELITQKEVDQPSSKDSSFRDGCVEGAFKWNIGRSIDMAFIRAGIIAPFVYEWYPFLAKVCPGGSFSRVVGRVALDQAIGSPFVIINVFAAMSYLHDGNLSGTYARIKEQFFSTWTAGLQYWPFVHLITFGVIPPKYQTLFAHFASVYWNAVLSYYANKSNQKIEEKIDIKPDIS